LVGEEIRKVAAAVVIVEEVGGERERGRRWVK
jgi:hypothetical protein